MKVLADFHHTSLLNSLIMLFEGRLGAQLYRPIGLDWYTEKYWDVFPHLDTANQYLSLDQGYRPSDGTPPLNNFQEELEEGVFLCNNPETGVPVKAATLDYIKNTNFDLFIASIPQHIEPFKRLIASYQPHAKLIFQVGNDWNVNLPGLNVLASVAPRTVSTESNVVFYHQEFDLNVFTPSPIDNTGEVYSFLNVLQESVASYAQFLALEQATNPMGFSWKSFGGQCRDGCITGSRALADKMREAEFIYHVKPGGDGFGHILHNAYAVGRPVITNKHHYRGQWGEQLLVPGSYIDTYGLSAELIARKLYTADVEDMSELAYKRFKEVVDFDKEEQEIRQWLERLI